MAVTRISWPTVATAGSTVVYAVLIVGLPYLIVPDGVTVSSVSWTGDADTAWHVGASPTTKGWLLRKHARSDTPALAWEETAQPVTGALDIGSLRIHLADPTVGLTAVTASLASRDSMSFTRLTADLTAAGTTVTVESTAAFDASGTIHLGRERITYSGKTSTTFTGCTRGTAGTKARAYSVAGAQIHRVYGQPSGATVECLPGVLGRRVTLWALSLSGGTATDPTLLYDGRIAKGAQALDSGAFELPIEHAAKALAQASAAPELTLYGWAHGGNTRDVGATVVGSYYGSPLWSSWAASDTEYHTLNNAAADPDNGGWSATLEQYVDRWNRAARTDGADVRASIRSDGGLSIQATDLVTPRRLVVWQGWTETARAYPGDSGDTATTAVVLTDVCPPCCLWLAGDVHLDSAALAQVPAVPSNPVHAATGDAVYSYWTLACERDNRRLPKTRITSWISAVGASSVTCVALDHGSPDGFSRLESLLTKPTVATVGIWARSVTWWSGIRYGVFAQIESLRGLDHVSDSVDWTRVRTVAEQSSAHPTRREYVVDVSKPPLDLLRNEAFLAGCALATYHGRLSLVRVRDVAVTEARDGTLTSAHLRRGRVATLTEVASGLATAYKLRFPTGDVLSVQDAGAIAESGAGATIEATLPAGVYERDDVVTDSAVQSQTIALAQAVLAPFVRPYQVVSWPGDLRLAGHQIGDTLLLSEWLAPDQAGGRGLTSAAGQVLGRRIDLDAGTVDLRLRLSPAAVSGYAPEALVSGISGAVLTLDTATLGAQGFADEGTTDGGASTFAAGDKVCLIEIDATSPATPFQGEVASVSGATVTLTASPGGSWPSRASSGRVLLSFDDYSTVTAAQHAWAFIADVTTYQHADGEQGRRWA